MRLSNTFEGGTDGVAIATGNSGGVSGDAFDTVTLSGTGAVVFDDDAGVAAGTFSALVSSTDASASTAFVEWSTSWQTETEVWTRMYFRLSASPAAPHPIVRLMLAGVGPRILLDIARTLSLWDGANNNRYTSSTVLAADTAYRIEFHVVHSETVGHMEARIFHGANLHGTTPDEAFGNLTDNWNTLASSDGVRFGRISTAAGALLEWFDGTAIDNTDWIGPISTSVANDSSNRIGGTGAIRRPSRIRL